MFLSYLVTCHNETDSLDKLLNVLVNHKKETHEIVLIDDYSDNQTTIDIIEKYKDKINYHQRKLDRDYGAHKNYGIEKCRGEWIFQLDADECPTDLLINHIDIMLSTNSTNDVIWLPRLNIFDGVTDDDIKMWGWKYYEGYINFPDYQSRLFRNLPNIRYQRRLHEKVEGFKSYTFIPPQMDYAIVHEKTIEKQRETNIKYNKMFSEEENRGYTVK
jgi:glycosyltransferase involved in cell wall biosynthesis